MSTTKKVVVFPASGFQGRSVCEALSKNPQYEVVGIVRNLKSAKINTGGIDLHKLNVKLVQGDFKDPAGYRECFKGAYSVFVNTDFWSIYAENGGDLPGGIKTELQYGENVIDEAKAAGVLHFVFSSLFKACEIPEDMYITASRKLNAYLEKSGLPYTIYYSSGYYENLALFDMVKPQEDGSIFLNLMCPDRVRQQFTSIATVGIFVKTILDDRDKFLGKEVLNTNAEMTWGDFATGLSRISGKKVTTPNFSDEVWNSEQMKAGMGEYWRIFDTLLRTYEKAYFPGYTGTEVVPSIPDFDQWARNDPYIKEKFGL